MEKFEIPLPLFQEQSFREKMLKHKSVILIAIAQIAFILLFGGFADYGSSAKPSKEVPPSLVVKCNTSDCTVFKHATGPGYQVHVPDRTNISFELKVPEKKSSETDRDYALFQDCHVMIFIGFGFLMTFLKRYAYSAVSINLLLAAFVIQWHTLFLGFFEMKGTKLHIGLSQIVLSEFCAGAVLISMGAVLGKMSPFQYLAMAFFEVVFYTINEYIVFIVFSANDVGGSMNLHTFGAYFGLTIARILYDPALKDHGNERTVYFSNVFSIIGCLFLWIYWPSFNGMIATPDDARHRAIINTYFSLAACTLCTFATSAMLHRNTQFDMDLIQNATLAGGVAVGSAANLFLTPLGAVITGSIAGCLSVFGFEVIQPYLLKKLKLHDTCGVHNLHGMPGILGGIVSIIMCAMATDKQYGSTLTDVFPARGDMAGAHVIVAANRSAVAQAAFQLAALAVSLAFAIIGGLITGLLLKLPLWDNITEENQYFNDEVFFETTDDFAELADMILDAVDERRRRSSLVASNASSRGLSYNNDSNNDETDSNNDETDSNNDSKNDSQNTSDNEGSTLGNLEDVGKRRKSVELSPITKSSSAGNFRGRGGKVVELPADAPLSILNKKRSSLAKSESGVDSRRGSAADEPRRMSVSFAAPKDKKEEK